MSLKESKIKLLTKIYTYLNKLLNISNSIEYTLNFVNHFDYDKYNLINIHSLNENTFNYNMYNFYYEMIDNINNIDNINDFDNKFKYVYRMFNKTIDKLENIIKVYSKFIKHNILCLVLVNDLNLNNNVKNYSEFFKNYDFYLFLKSIE